MANVILSVIPNNAFLMALTANHPEANASKMNLCDAHDLLFTSLLGNRSGWRHVMLLTRCFAV